MTDAPIRDTPIRDAATVVILRRSPEGSASVLMGMRGEAAAFMPSKFVFPGGAVDPADHAWDATHPVETSLGAEPREGSSVTGAALLACARRELQEETGLVLQPGATLHFFFRAITPLGRPRRFDARFLLIDAAAIAGDPDDFSAACDELSHLAWVPIEAALGLDLPFITEVVLAEVAAVADRDWPLQGGDGVPFFDSRGTEPRFVRIAR